MPALFLAAGAASVPIHSAFPLAIGFPQGGELVVILVIALLIFGKRLPEVMRSMGRGVVEFKKGVKGIEDEIDVESNRSPSIEGSSDVASGSGDGTSKD
ncbi:MAG: Sec-independent protein translocase subunit TatA/TatB [Planctomycetota bacterium]|jgi:sec-independent protein translocase protein TatA